MNDVDELGLLKFDLLAIKTLTVIDKTVKMIKSRHDRDIDIDKLEPNDPKVLKSFMDSTTGLFQFESSEMHRMLCNISVDSFEDLIVANALYRPGPLGEGMHEMFAEYKHNPSKVKYLHPKMGEALKDTYGILVYQENLMKVCRVLAGFTGGQSDTFRKVVGKKKIELIKKEKLDELFINGCVKNGISKDVAEQIFKHMLHFAGYGFNKCLSGDTLVYNNKDDSMYSLEELESIFRKSNHNWRYVDLPISIDSYVDGKVVEDEVVDVFETGEQEIFEIQLSNGMTVKCTLNHKFYCLDGQPHTVKEIMEQDLEILCDENDKIREGK
jgi:DNA polymerase-3 subunit alpha